MQRGGRGNKERVKTQTSSGGLAGERARERGGRKKSGRWGEGGKEEGMRLHCEKKSTASLHLKT